MNTNLPRNKQVMKKGSVISICPECRNVVTIRRFETISLDNGDEEIGIRCPKCDHWQTSYYLNQELKDMQQIKTPTRKDKRDYERKFKKFQKVMKRKHGSIPA